MAGVASVDEHACRPPASTADRARRGAGRAGLAAAAAAAGRGDRALAALEPPRTADGGAADRRCGAHGLRQDDPSRLLGRLDAAPGGVGFRRIAGARRRRRLGSRCGRTRAGRAEAAPRPARRPARADGDGCRPALRRADPGAGRIRASEPLRCRRGLRAVPRPCAGDAARRGVHSRGARPRAAAPTSPRDGRGARGCRPRPRLRRDSGRLAVRFGGPRDGRGCGCRRPTHRGMARRRLSRGPRGADRAGAGRGARRLLRCGAGRLRLSPPRVARRAAGRDAPVVPARDLGPRAAQCASVRRIAPPT